MHVNRIIIALVAAFALLAMPAPAERASEAPPGDTLLYTLAEPRHPGSVTAGPFAVRVSASYENPVTILVKPGDTYGRWAITYCGTFAAWPALQRANGWPERRIPVGAKAVMDCTPIPAATRATFDRDWIHPLASEKRATSCYRTKKRPSHGGVDIAQPSGTRIYAVAAGTVSYKGFERRGAGYYVQIRHAGNVYSQYHHLRTASPLAKGASVEVGQLIGYVGATGNATGPHLHFELRKGGSGSGYRTNPATFMRARGVEIGC
jgi:murein DD-endopeptidase MepM/ murein hydrolase activator NlpD